MKPQVTQVLSLLLAKGEIDRLLKTLEKFHAQFESEGENDLWLAWKCQAYAASGIPERALEILPEITDPNRRLETETIILSTVAEQSSDKRAFADHLYRAFEGTRNPIFLMHWCEIMATTGQWEEVAGKVTQLFESIRTTAALRLAAFAMYNTGKWQECLRIL